MLGNAKTNEENNIQIMRYKDKNWYIDFLCNVSYFLILHESLFAVHDVA